jgi:hypothetical protein
MSLKNLAFLGLFVTFVSSVGTPAFAETKPKYGPEATLLRNSHEYVQKHAAPDFWALIPYYTAQQTGSACSIASVSMVINAARIDQKLTADDELATQNNVLKKTGDEEWTKAVSDHGGGRSLDQLGVEVQKAFKAYGFKDAKVEVIHVSDLSPATRAKVHAALVENEKSAGDFIIANFIQGVFTGDADAGHIAPVAAYDAKARRVLILDPDRDWYEPYWVSEETFLKGMNTADKSADGKFRGLVWVEKR